MFDDSCILLSCRPWFLDNEATSMQLSSRERCRASCGTTSLVCWFCFWLLCCCNSSPCPPAAHWQVLPKCSCIAALHATGSSTCFCTGSGIYVHQLQRHLRFALVHGMSSPSRQLPGNPMRVPQQHEIIIVRWTCWHVYWNPSPTSSNLRCERSPTAALGAFCVLSRNYCWCFLVKLWNLIAYNSFNSRIIVE